MVLKDLSSEHLRPTVDIVRSLPTHELDADGLRLVSDGRPLPLGDPAMATGQQVALVSGDRLLAIYKRRGPQLVAEKVLPS